MLLAAPEQGDSTRLLELVRRSRNVARSRDTFCALRPKVALPLRACGVLPYADQASDCLTAAARERGDAAGEGTMMPAHFFARLKTAVALLALALSPRLATGQVCGGTGAHDKHAAFPAACATCHPCGGLLGIAVMTFPRGTSTFGAQIVGSNPASCTVACHFPFGGTPTSIDWDVQGPLNCTSCHFQIADGGTFLSAHATPDPDPVVERSGCEGCHALGTHLSGTVRIFTGEGTSIDVPPGVPADIDVACKNCHDGAGNALTGRTPPLLVGFEDQVAGDFHGARAGTGYGGTLIGFQRGEGPLPCKECHDTHASANPYMFAANVNGTIVPPAAMNRAGVGGEALCESCHAGVRHQGCVNCHGFDPQPSGSACFFCHGHEGIVSFVWPSPTVSLQQGTFVHATYQQDAGCSHCHSPGWGPVIEYAPPPIRNGLVQVTNVTGNSATISWNTDEAATSYVEYGLGTPSRVAGSNAFVTGHSVTLTGLSEATAYVFRVRTGDKMRNVTLSPLMQFSTLSVEAPPAPTLVSEADVAQCDPLGSVVLNWNAVVDLQGDPVEYRALLDDSPAFDSPVADSGWIPGRTFSAIIDLAYPPFNYYWAVQARDATHDARSPWSGVDHFYGMWDPWCE
jgi:hypothetical protein